MGKIVRLLIVAALSMSAVSLCGGVALGDVRVALVIGNGAYRAVPHLPNPPHDAEDVAVALKRMGFQTITGIDLDQAGMQNATIRFARAARTADVAIFYYSGHAMQFSGVNYLVPVDAQLHDEADLRRMARVDEILSDLQQAKNLRILVLDSCRDNPLADELKRSIGVTRSAGLSRGLAKMESPDGTIISYSTQSGLTARDGDGRNSPYTAAFLKHIDDKEEVSTVFRRISANVRENTAGTQTPELSLSFFNEFYLNGKLQAAVAPATAPVDPCASADAHWKSTETINTRSAFEDHLARFPNCAFAGLARAKIEALSKTAVARPAETVTAPSSAEKPGLFDRWFGSAATTKEAVADAPASAPPEASQKVAVVAAPSPRAPDTPPAPKQPANSPAAVQTSLTPPQQGTKTQPEPPADKDAVPNLPGCDILQTNSGSKQRKITLFFSTNPKGREAAQSARKAITASGWKITSDISMPLNTPDYSVFLMTVKLDQADVVVFCGASSDTLVQQGKTFNVLLTRR